MKKMLSVLLMGLMFIGLLAISACSNTLEGVGKDIEKMGKEIQDR